MTIKFVIFDFKSVVQSLVKIVFIFFFLFGYFVKERCYYCYCNIWYFGWFYYWWFL